MTALHVERPGFCRDVQHRDVCEQPGQDMGGKCMQRARPQALGLATKRGEAELQIIAAWSYWVRQPGTGGTSSNPNCYRRSARTQQSTRWAGMFCRAPEFVPNSIGMHWNGECKPRQCTTWFSGPTASSARWTHTCSTRSRPQDPTPRGCRAVAEPECPTTVT